MNFKFNLSIADSMYKRMKEDSLIDISYKSINSFINRFVQEIIYHEVYLLSSEDREVCFSRAVGKCEISDDDEVHQINLLRLAINNPDFDKDYYEYLFGSSDKKSYIKDEHYVLSFSDKVFHVVSYRPPKYLGVIITVLLEDFNYKWIDIAKLVITNINYYFDEEDTRYDALKAIQSDMR